MVDNPKVEKRLGLHPNVLYMVMAIEAKVAEFGGKLNELNNQLQQVEQQRQVLIANINQVQGAITGGRIMVDEELTAAGCDREFYEKQRDIFLKELQEKEAAKQEEPGKVLKFPEQGQDNEIAETTNNDAARGDAG